MVGSRFHSHISPPPPPEEEEEEVNGAKTPLPICYSPADGNILKGRRSSLHIVPTFAILVVVGSSIADKSHTSRPRTKELRLVPRRRGDAQRERERERGASLLFVFIGVGVGEC